MENSTSTILLFSAILITGIVTVITDLRFKKIYNTHLIFCTLLGLAAITYTILWTHGNVLFHYLNGLIAFLIGFTFYRMDLWRGGDAKLYILYALLMPPFKEGNTIFSSAFNLLACSFIAGAMIFLPIFIKDFTANKNGEFSPESLKVPFNTIKLTILLSWALFPVYHFAFYCLEKTVHTGVIFQLITYVIFYINRRFLRKKIQLNFITVICGIVLGLLLRFLLNAQSLSWPALPYFLLKTTFFSCLSSLIYVIQTDFKKYQDRVPFAPLLFIGCLLSYTPFLAWIKQLTTR